MVTNKQAGGVAAVVLAAGMSRRMGTAKQLLRLGEKAVLERTLQAVRSSQAAEIVLVLGAEAGEIRRQLSLEGLKVIFNPEYYEGMGTSLRAGLGALSESAQGALIVLADQPFIRPQTLDRLVDYYHQSAAEIVLPLYKGFRGNPVLLDRSVFPEVMGLSGDVGCRAIFGSHTEGIRKFEVDDPGVLLDVDTDEDLRRLQEFSDAHAHGAFRLPDIEQRLRAGQDEDRPDLVIIGHDEMARALGKLGRVLKFNVTFVDPLLQLADLPEADRVLHVLDFSLLPSREKLFVVASRGQCDEEALEQALTGESSYVALVANRNRAEEVLQSLRMRRIAEDKLSTVCSPAGLPIGAQSAEEVALSILAEIISARRKALNPR
jgi:molybdenum cofactor cytidylyltransferase